MTDSAGQQVGTVSQAVTVPVGVAAASCQILDLVLGPLDLDLLGLVVHLNQVHLNITADAGPGNLLCAIAGLLDPGPPDQPAGAGQPAEPDPRHPRRLTVHNGQPSECVTERPTRNPPGGPSASGCGQGWY